MTIQKLGYNLKVGSVIYYYDESNYRTNSQYGVVIKAFEVSDLYSNCVIVSWEKGAQYKYTVRDLNRFFLEDKSFIIIIS
jgi:hypothetical protein